MEQKIAFYLRSSMEQNEKLRNSNNPDESDTIANQRKLLYKVALTKGFDKEQIVEYVDDGHTGVNFDRPAFKQLIADVDNGLVAVVMVKDFSRLGRDYIGVGEYVEQYFPARDVRIISINDDWDSDEHVGETLELDASFRTMIYDMYSKDLSAKRKSANQARHKSGIFIGAFVPFGYKKDPDDIHKYVVDEATAPIVKRVFQMFLAGEKIGNIAKVFNDEGVISPARAKEELHSYEAVTKNADLWTSRAVGVILRNELYTGTLILNRYSIKELKSNVCVKNDESEWVKFPNSHEAIISMEDFNKAQKRLSRSKAGTAPSTDRKAMPLYCGHCGLKLRSTTRNEGTCICHTGNMMPYEPCGQIQVRKTAIQNVMVKAINVQAKILLDEAKNSKATSKELRMLQKTFAQLEAKKQGYRDERMNLYKDFKAGRIERDKFLTRKAEVLKQEEECLAEYEVIQSKIEKLQHKQEHIQAGTEAFREYSLLSEYDYDVVNHLISRVECFNDGHIKIAWNFKSEFKGAEPVEEAVNDTPAEKSRVAVYTSDLWMMPQDSDYTISKRNASNYCVKKLTISEENITFYHDDKADDGVYFREGYMKFIDEGRRGAVEALVIDSFKDLYLAHQDLENLIRFIIPKLPCRFISVSDGFDSATADDNKYQEMYDSYKHVRQGDIMKYRTIERKAGKRVAATMRYPQCPMLYGYHTREDGSYADTEVIALIQQIYDKVLEIKKLSKVARWLNDQGIPTSQAFLNEEGYDRPERVKKWNAEKLWGVTKQEGYVSYCKYYDRCKELGKHCDRKPIIDKDKFDEVNEKYAYRKNR